MADGNGTCPVIQHSKFGVAEVEKVWDGCREIWPCCVFLWRSWWAHLVGPGFRGEFMVVVRRDPQVLRDTQRVTITCQDQTKNWLLGLIKDKTPQKEANLGDGFSHVMLHPCLLQCPL